MHTAPSRGRQQEPGRPPFLPRGGEGEEGPRALQADKAPAGFFRAPGRAGGVGGSLMAGVSHLLTTSVCSPKLMRTASVSCSSHSPTLATMSQ